MNATADTPSTSAWDLTAGWENLAAWRIIETQFGAGESFLNTWFSWRNDPNRPRLLHFVAFTPAAPNLDALNAQVRHHPAWQGLLEELTPHWFGLLPGFHRISLDQGRVLLTLCIGGEAELLRQQHFLADAVSLGNGTGNGHAAWDIWTVKALVRCCRRGTRLYLRQAKPDLMTLLVQCGFVLNPLTGPEQQNLVFDPRWTLKNSRNPPLPITTPAGTCVVIGAGLAGASVAASLARRGWQVVVLEGGATPASGASGLPVGLVAPHGSVDDCQLSRLSRVGVRLMLGEAARFLDAGEDWALTGAMEYRVDRSPGLSTDWPTEGLEWSQAMPLSDSEAVPSIWHGRSAWIKPAQLIRAWLSLPNITVQSNAQVASLTQMDGRWSVFDAQGHALASGDRVVFANATGALPLLEQVQKKHPERHLQLNRLPQLHGVRGQVTFGRHVNAADAMFPPTPINGSGSIIAQIPMAEGWTWFVGSSFQPDRQPSHSPEHNHWANFERLKQLKPSLAMQLKPLFGTTKLLHWENTRCVTADRLPIVGALGDTTDTDLWVCAGMGSRGLSFSVLCAELLAAQWGGEPLPMEFNLAQSFNALRATR